MQTKPKVAPAPKKESNVVSAGSNPSGVIYVDQDSDITSIVSKIRQEQSKNLKIVVPKNSAALKSGVNLKLLARTAKSKSKNLALITSDPKLNAMAGAARISTSPNLTSEPTLHLPKNTPADFELEEDAAPKSSVSKPNKPQPDLDEEDLTIDGSEFTAASSNSKAKLNQDAQVPAESEQNPAKTKTLKKSQKAGLGKKIPNFEGFRKKAIIGLAIFFSIVIILFIILTSKKTATVEVRANAERYELSFVAKLNESASATTEGELKVQKKSGSKTITESVAASGQQNIGAKASGSIKITNCTDSALTISAGTATASSGLNYLTNTSVFVPASDFFSNGTCKNNGNATVNVTAKEAGSEYNVGAKAYTISGVPAKITGQGSAMSGGTTQIVKVVSDADVNSLKEKITSTNQDAYKKELQDQLGTDQQALQDTFKVDLSTVQLTPAVGQQAEQVSGTATATYSMLAVDKSQLKSILELQLAKLKKDPTQTIIKDGLDELKLSPAEDSGYQFNTVAYLGPPLDLEKIKQDIAGKKKGEAIAIIGQFEAVDSSNVKIKPFWAAKLPAADKIQVNVSINQTN